MIRWIWRRQEAAQPRGPELNPLYAAVEAQMETLLRLVDEEATLVRSGALKAADRVKRRQTRCAGEFIEAIEAVKRIRPALEQNSPQGLDRLQQRHAEFRFLLQLGLAALDSAREAEDNRGTLADERLSPADRHGVRPAASSSDEHGLLDAA